MLRTPLNSPSHQGIPITTGNKCLLVFGIWSWEPAAQGRTNCRSCQVHPSFGCVPKVALWIPVKEAGSYCKQRRWMNGQRASEAGRDERGVSCDFAINCINIVAGHLCVSDNGPERTISSGDFYTHELKPHLWANETKKKEGRKENILCFLS